MNRKIRNRLLIALAIIVLLIGGSLSYLSLELSGWPGHHLSEPAFASAIDKGDWPRLFDEGRLNAALTNALVQRVGKKLLLPSWCLRLTIRAFSLCETRKECAHQIKAEQISGFVVAATGLKTSPL